MSEPPHEVHLHDPQTLYRHWEESQWSPWDIDLSTDREQWTAMEDRSLVSFVLGSLMVAEERITTKFSGLVGADGSEEEVTFLATQQVDEARHMQFYARFQDEVVAEPAVIAAHVERARAQVSPAFQTIFDERLVAAHERLRRQPRRSGREGRVRDDLPPDPRGHARADDVRVLDALHGARGPAAGIRRGLHEDSP